MKLWNVGANVTNIQKGRGKRKWSHKISEIHKKKHYNQNILTEMTGFSKKIDEKIPKPQTIENITKDLQKKFQKKQTNILTWTEKSEEKISNKRKIGPQLVIKEGKTQIKQRKIQRKIREEKQEQQQRTLMQNWIQNPTTPKRTRERTIRDDTPEPNLTQTIKDLIYNIQGTVIPIHGDGACWFRAIAKACYKTPMQIIADLEKGIRDHKHRRNRTDGNFVTTLNEKDEKKILSKLHHYKIDVPLTDGIAVQTQPTQWWGGL